MAIQMADSALLDHQMVHDAVDHVPVTYITDPIEDHDRTSAVRGIMTAMVISAPFWALIGFTIYLLL